jgi:hypothetical protein
METDKPFRKSFICAAFLFAVLASAVAFLDPNGLVKGVLAAFAISLTIALVTGTWGRLSKASWSWTRFGATVMGLFLVYVFSSSLLRKIVSSMTQGL